MSQNSAEAGSGRHMDAMAAADALFAHLRQTAPAMIVKAVGRLVAAAEHAPVSFLYEGLLTEAAIDETVGRLKREAGDTQLATAYLDAASAIKDVASGLAGL